MRSAESWYNEYRGRRNDGALRAEQHLQFIREVQEDASRGAHDELERRLLMALGQTALPASILLALRDVRTTAPRLPAATTRTLRPS